MSNQSEENQPEKPQTKQIHQNHQILQNVGEFYLNEKNSDVHFLFGLDDNSISTVRVPSHKFLLAAESDVFEAMLYGELKEKVMFMSKMRHVMHSKNFYNISIWTL